MTLYLLSDVVSVNILNIVPFGHRNSKWRDSVRPENRCGVQARRVLEQIKKRRHVDHALHRHIDRWQKVRLEVSIITYLANFARLSIL